jgi:Winged helix DNA-binding domain
MTRAFSADRRQLTALRIAAQHIDRADLGSPAEVVRHMLAMQGQDFAGAKWAIGVRSSATTDADVELAIANGEIVRSWPMRGTLHFVAPEDLGWMLALCRARIIRGATTRFAELGLNESILRRAEEIATDSLTGGRLIGRTEIQALFESAGIETSGQRGYSILWYLSIIGVLTFGPLLGKQHSFVLLDDWVTNARHLTGDEALGEFARRYFRGHGPATVRDFAWWSSLTLGDARRGLEIARSELDELAVGDERYFLARDAQSAARGVQMLPGFDEYILGYHDRRAALSEGAAIQVIPGKNGIFMPTVIVDGEVVGIWRRKLTSRQVIIDVSPLVPLSAGAVKGCIRATKRFENFLKIPVIVRELD